MIPTAAPTVIVMTVAANPTSEGDAGAVDHEIEDRPPEVVGAERELRRRRLERFSRRIGHSQVLR